MNSLEVDIVTILKIVIFNISHIMHFVLALFINYKSGPYLAT